MTAPLLSLVVPVHASARQAERALATLCSPYQEDPRAPVEILVVEAASGDRLGEERARAHGENVRYLELEGNVAHRSRSLAVGLKEGRGRFVGLLRDGAHCVTPRFLSVALRALRLDERPLVLLPEYRLDATRVPAGGGADAELAWFEGSRFRDAPYDSFSSFRWGPSNPNGFLGPVFGAACLLAPKTAFEAVSAFDPENDVPGGAPYALWSYMELARAPGTRLIVLAGEGAVRLHHAELDSPRVRLQEENQATLLFDALTPLGTSFRPLHREPVAFGPVTGPLQPFLAESAALAEFHCAMCRNRGEPSWHEDPPPA